MNPQNCIQAVSSHTPFDPAEAESIAATLAFLAEHHPCWQRDNYVGYLAAWWDELVVAR